jgi:hypothetical protein
MEAGKAAFTIWIPAELQKQIVELATAEQATTSAVAERLLMAGIYALAEPAHPEPSDATEFNQDLGAFKAAVGDYRNAGITGYGAIAAALADGGYRNSNGNLYTRETVKRTLIRAGLVAGNL